MSAHDCEQTLNAGSWVLGALPDDEAPAYAIHLRGCEACSTEVARLQAVADVLPMAADQVDPPRELRGRILDVVRAEAARSQAAERGGSRWWRPAPRRVAAVAAGCLAVGVAAFAVTGGREDDGNRIRTVPAPTAFAGAQALLTVDGAHARLVVRRMPAPPEGRIYQVWKLREGAAPEPTDALFTVRKDGSATVDVPDGVAGVDRVLVTAEPVGGSDSPTTRPIVSAVLS